MIPIHPLPQVFAVLFIAVLQSVLTTAVSIVPGVLDTRYSEIPRYSVFGETRHVQPVLVVDIDTRYRVLGSRYKIIDFLRALSSAVEANCRFIRLLIPGAIIHLPYHRCGTIAFRLQTHMHFNHHIKRVLGAALLFCVALFFCFSHHRHTAHPATEPTRRPPTSQRGAKALPPSRRPATTRNDVVVGVGAQS